MLVKRVLLLFIMIIAAGFVYAKTIALVQINQQAQFFTDMNRGAEAEAAKLGHKLVIFNANNDPAAQNNAIETYIQQKVDGLIVVAIDTNGIMPAVIQAANAGIPVVAVDAILPDGPQIAQVGVNNYGAGVLIANAFLDYVSKEMGGEVSIGIVGALNSTIQNVRQKGFTDTLSCGQCQKMGEFVKDEALLADCSSCCNDDSDSATTYASAVLEVCS